MFEFRSISDWMTIIILTKEKKVTCHSIKKSSHDNRLKAFDPPTCWASFFWPKINILFGSIPKVNKKAQRQKTSTKKQKSNLTCPVSCVNHSDMNEWTKKHCLPTLQASTIQTLLMIMMMMVMIIPSMWLAYVVCIQHLPKRNIGGDCVCMFVRYIVTKDNSSSSSNRGKKANDAIFVQESITNASIKFK